METSMFMESIVWSTEWNETLICKENVAQSKKCMQTFGVMESVGWSKELGEKSMLIKMLHEIPNLANSKQWDLCAVNLYCTLGYC